MRWDVQTKLKANSPQLKAGELIKTLLVNRGIKDKKTSREFLEPTDPLTGYQAKLLGLNPAQLKKALARIKKAVKKNEPVVIYGDYDADGICATAIVWEALQKLGAKVIPFIPIREKEGYGLSRDGIDAIKADPQYGIGGKAKGLLVTVDNGIVAHEAVSYARKLGLEVIILDHHEKPARLPKAYAVIHTTKLCSAGIAFFVSRSLLAPNLSPLATLLELAAIATVTDLVPLTGANRSLVKYGLVALNNTSRPGLRALFDIAGVKHIGVYEIGFMIGPRLNASGRIESATTALQLLCSKDQEEARNLAAQLNNTNRDRQTMLAAMSNHALETHNLQLKTADFREKIIIAENESYHQGVIGLIAGRLVEQYYLPAVVISRGEIISKASARSVAGFNIIEAIRSCDNLLVNAGGHPMAAGFTIETEKIAQFRVKIQNWARKRITPKMLIKTLRVDGELDIGLITNELYRQIKALSPFGVGNPEPVFTAKVSVSSVRTVGTDGKHLKLIVSPAGNYPLSAVRSFDAIAFNLGYFAPKIKPGDQISLAYTIAEDDYGGYNRLQLKIKDLHYGGIAEKN